MRLLILLVFLVTLGCGSPTFNIGNDTYEKKLVIEGYLYPGQRPQNIKIRRNLPLIGSYHVDDLMITDASVTITDLETNTAYPLVYDNTISYFFSGIGGEVVYGRRYRLNVRAELDGDSLFVSSVTTVPDSGFSVDSLTYDSLFYRQSDSNEVLLPFAILLQRSPGASFYALSLNALDADTSTLIENNAYGDIKREDVLKSLPDYKYTQFEVENFPPGFGSSRFDIPWWMVSFYGDYRGIFYAGDKNFKDFFLTYSSVQDIDGSLYDPVMHIEGDGIGVFGSAVIDTVYFKVLRQ